MEAQQSPRRPDERRAARRTAARIDARLRHDDTELDGVVVDISFGGAKLVTRRVTPLLAVGDRVTLTVAAHAATGGRELTWGGTVVRLERSGDDGPERVAYAIAFDDDAAGGGRRGDASAD